MNINRMLVTPTDSHVTEQRKIEVKIQEGVQLLKQLTAELDENLFDRQWADASHTATTITTVTEYIQKLEYRLEDVRGINEQFAQIQAHLDRLQLRENSNGTEDIPK